MLKFVIKANTQNKMKPNFDNFMKEALHEARQAGAAGEVPIGAVIIKDKTIIARGQNRTRRDNDPTAHAEIIAIRQACAQNQSFRLNNHDIYVTLEPCAMCAGAIAEARIARLYFGAEDEKSGGTLHGAQVFSHKQCHHQPEIYPEIHQKESQKLLQDFFAEQRETQKNSQKK